MMVVKRTVLMTMAASPENVGPGRTRLDVSMEPEPGQFYVPPKHGDSDFAGRRLREKTACEWRSEQHTMPLQAKASQIT